MWWWIFHSIEFYRSFEQHFQLPNTFRSSWDLLSCCFYLIFFYWNIIINSKNQHRGLIFQIECFNSHNVSALFCLVPILKINSKHGNNKHFANSFMLYLRCYKFAKQYIVVIDIYILYFFPSTEIFVRWLLCSKTVFYFILFPIFMVTHKYA